jgi:hypothetical protein
LQPIGERLHGADLFLESTVEDLKAARESAA